MNAGRIDGRASCSRANGFRHYFPGVSIAVCWLSLVVATVLSPAYPGAVDSAAETLPVTLVGLYLATAPGAIAARVLPSMDPHAEGFEEPHTTPVLTQGKDHWFYFDVPPPANTETAERTRYLQVRFPNIDRVSAFVVQRDGRLLEYLLGDDVAHKRWPIATRLPTLRLGNSTGADAVGVFLRLEPTGQPAVLPVVLLTQKQFLRHQQIEYLWYGAFFGACAVLVAYNLFLYVATRVGSYFLYVVYLSVFTLLQASTSGLGQQYLWPQANQFTTNFALVLIGLTNAAVLWFVVGFLQQHERHPRWHALLLGASVVALCLPALLFLPGYIVAQNTQHAFSVFCMVLIYAFAIVVFREGSRPAAYLLVSYTILFAGILLALLRYNGLVGTTFLTEHLMEAAIVLEAVILSLGLADRINDLQEKNRQAAIDARERQARFSRELILAHESEKRQFGSALHDHVGHALVGMQYRVRQMRQQFASSSPMLEENMRLLEADADSLHEDIRELARQAHPHLLSQLGLASALDRLLDRALDGHPLQGHLSCSDARLDNDTELHLYRIVQECVSNTLRHANASELLISIEIEPDGYELLYRDDGVGLTNGAVASDTGFGLLSIRQRCNILGASMTLGDEGVPGFCLRVRRVGSQGSGIA